MRRFGDEVLLHSQQRHPNIVQLIGVYYPPRSQLPMLVMEYLPLSLTQCLEREELPLQMKYSILLDVAKGLCYLHGKRPPIVHRDLTANNVLLTSSYSAKISDLGVSRLADTFKKHNLSKAPGNAMVMPPEALEDNPEYDHKLDVFSYGCLILHVLTGRFPEPTNQLVPEPGRKNSFTKVPEWDRRSNYIKIIPKENELLPLAKKCLNHDPTGRPEMIKSYQSVEEALSNHPKMKNRLVVEKELNDAIQEKEEMEKKLVQEREEAERSIQKLNDENAASKRENEILKTENEHIKADLRTMSSRVTGLGNVLSLKEMEIDGYKRVLTKTIRSKEEELAKQEQDLRKKHSTKLSKTKEHYELKLFEIKEEHEAKMLVTTKDHEEQLSVCREECKERVAKVMEEFTSKTSETLESAVISKNELLSSFQSAPLASIPSIKAQMELVIPYLSFQDKKVDEWLVSKQLLLIALLFSFYTIGVSLTQNGLLNGRHTLDITVLV